MRSCRQPRLGRGFLSLGVLKGLAAIIYVLRKATSYYSDWLAGVMWIDDVIACRIG